MRRARDWFLASFHAQTPEEFETLCPRGSESNAYFRMVTSYWEMAASFVTSGVLNQELLFQSSGELAFVWERLRALAPATRAMYKNPHMMKNLETVAEAYVRYQNERAPDWYAGFRQMVHARPAAQPGKTERAAG